jgi:hypothetical protein
MGRPLRKDVNGVDVIGTPGPVGQVTAATGITVEFHDGNVQTDGIIVKQRGAKTFVVSRVGNVAVNLTKTPNTFTCVLVSGTPAAGQMRLRGSTAGTLDTGLVSLAKITKRVATDFSGNKYTWFLENDSSADYIVLTPIA